MQALVYLDDVFGDFSQLVFRECLRGVYPFVPVGTQCELLQLGDGCAQLLRIAVKQDNQQHADSQCEPYEFRVGSQVLAQAYVIGERRADDEPLRGVIAGGIEVFSSFDACRMAADVVSASIHQRVLHLFPRPVVFETAYIGLYVVVHHFSLRGNQGYAQVGNHVCRHVVV